MRLPSELYTKVGQSDTCPVVRVHEESSTSMDYSQTASMKTERVRESARASRNDPTTLADHLHRRRNSPTGTYIGVLHASETPPTDSPFVGY